MATKSVIDEFAAGIVIRTSVYLTGCLGVLLTIAILFRRFDPPDAARLTLLEESLVLLATLAFTYVAAWCAGSLAVSSTKNRLLRSNASSYRRGAPRDEDRQLIKRTTDTTHLVSEERETVDRERQHAPSIQGGPDAATTALRMAVSPPEITRHSVEREYQRPV